MLSAYSGQDADIARMREALRRYLLLNGAATLFIPLNGGSDTRRAARDHWRAIALAHGIPFLSFGHEFRLGGAIPRNKGWRFHVTDRSGAWINWRRHKRLARKAG